MDEIGAYQDSSLKELRILGQNTTIALEKGNTLYSPLKSPFGHISLLLNAHTGAPEQYFRYTAYGECTLFDARKNTLALSASLTPWMLSSKRYDQETGFTLYGLRYYAPNIGRWITPDPAGFQDGPNLYTYVHNNPIAFTDLYGLSSSWSDIWNFCKPIVTEVGIYTGIAVVGFFNPPAGVYLAQARTAYNYARLAHTGYQVGNAVYQGAKKEGWEGAQKVLSHIGNELSRPETMAQIAVSFAATKKVNQVFKNLHILDDFSYDIEPGNLESTKIELPTPEEVVPFSGKGSPIRPYKELKKLTKGLKGEFQAHHILEQRHMKRLGYSAKEILNAPAQILSRPEHQQITNLLRDSMPYGTSYFEEGILKNYQVVYADRPEFLEAIKHLVN